MKLYLLGFFASILLTLGAYFAASFIVWIAIFSILQILIQFVCFLRVGESLTLFDENGIFFLFTILIALTVVFGSLWIMMNLNYRM